MLTRASTVLTGAIATRLATLCYLPTVLLPWVKYEESGDPYPISIERGYFPDGACAPEAAGVKRM